MKETIEVLALRRAAVIASINRKQAIIEQVRKSADRRRSELAIIDARLHELKGKNDA